MNIMFYSLSKIIRNNLLIFFSLIFLTGYFNSANADFYADKTEYRTDVIRKVKSFKGKTDGTYDYETRKLTTYKNGYFVTFHQNQPDERGHYKNHYGYYSDEEYDKLTNELSKKYNLDIVIGIFDNEPEISFWTKRKSVAEKIVKKYNQHSYYDIKLNKIIKNPYYDKTKNPMKDN